MLLLDSEKEKDTRISLSRSLSNDLFSSNHFRVSSSASTSADVRPSAGPFLAAVTDNVLPLGSESLKSVLVSRQSFKVLHKLAVQPRVLGVLMLPGSGKDIKYIGNKAEEMPVVVCKLHRC